MMPLSRPPSVACETREGRNRCDDFAVIGSVPTDIKHDLVGTIGNIGLEPARARARGRFSPESRTVCVVVLFDPYRDCHGIVGSGGIEKGGIFDQRGGPYCTRAAEIE